MDSDDLDIHDPAFIRDPYAVYERLRRECPVARGERHGGYWLLTRYEDVREAARDWRTFTSSVPGVTSIPMAARRTEPQLPLEIDPPLHSRYRALVNPVFSPARIEALRPRVESLATSLVDSLLERSRTGTGTVVDLVTEYAVPLSVGTLAEFTGLPREDSHLWVEWQRRMFDVRNREDGARATEEMSAYIEGLIRDRKRAPRADDFISLLLKSEVDGHRLTDREIHAFCQLQFGAGFETTADAMSTTLHYLAAHPEARRQLEGAPDLIPTAVEEFLRFATPIQIFGRNATHDMELHGRQIKKGDVVAISFAAANHDQSVFANPDECMLDRTPNRHLTFGSGVHLCLGAPVARLELTVTLQQFTRRVSMMRLAAPSEAMANEGVAGADGAIWKRRGDRHGLACLPVQLRG